MVVKPSALNLASLMASSIKDALFLVGNLHSVTSRSISITDKRFYR